jgi:uncharacterized membrane protein
MYPWLVFLHVIGVFGFLMAHGVSAGVYFALRRERNADRIRVLLELARGTYGVAMLSLVMLFVTGIITGFMGQWWSRGWIWLSLILLIVLSGVMSVLGSRILNEARLGLGLPSTWNQSPRPEPMSAEEIGALLDRTRPILLTVIGFGGIVAIAWLMMFKPF